MKITIIFILLSISHWLYCQEFYEYPNRFTYSDETKVYKSIKNQNLNAYIFTPELSSENQKNPTIIFFHGGGWFEGTPTGFFRACRRFAPKGWITISIEYRLSDRKKVDPISCIMDAKSAVRWVRENSIELNVDPNKIVVAGQSAGGHLALSTAFISDFNENTDNLDISCVPNAIICYSTCYDTTRDFHFKSLLFNDDLLDSTSPYLNIASNSPPTLMFHSKVDEIVHYEQAEDFNRKMKEMNNIVELIMFDKGSHNLFPTYANKINQITEDFLWRMGFKVEDK